MTSSEEAAPRPLRLRGYVRLLAMAWTVVILGLLALQRESLTTLVWSYGPLWLLGLGGIGAGAWDIRRRLRERGQATEALRESEERIARLNRLMEDLLTPARLDQKIRCITDGVVEIFGADFARIWLIRPGDRCESGCMHAETSEGRHVCHHRDRCLHLIASSGRYTHTDGEGHRRVPFGSYKIGRVAAAEEPGFLTNDVTSDPRVHDHEWARRLGLVSFAGYRLQSPNGKTIGVLALFCGHALSSDEEALLQTTARTASEVVRAAGIEAERELLAQAVEQAAEAVIITDAEGRVQYASPTSERVSACTLEEAIGQGPRIQEGGEHADALHKEMWHTLNRGETWSSRIVNTRKDGTLCTAEATVMPVRDVSGGTVNYVAVTRDITKVVDLERRVQHAQKLESLGVMAGGIAHDFNNLLTAILGNASLALMELSSASPAREMLSQIETASQRAAELCKQMLAYSGKGRFVVENLDISAVVEEMVQMLEISISKKAVLKLNLAENLPAIRADATQIRQVVMNLITNASEAIGAKSGIISISTGAMECHSDYLSRTFLGKDLTDGTHVWLEVSDTGCGMDAATREKIFDPFFTTKFTGRGLGMAAVLGIVRGHSGAIKVYSEPGRGTTCKVLFPATSEPAEVSEPGQPSEGSWRGSGTILVADDEETVLAMATRTLRLAGFDTLMASDGREAVDAFRAHAYEIVCVLLDLTMPHLDGVQVFTELRRIRPDVCVVLSSGYNQQDATERFVGKGLAGFVQKPYRPRDLIGKIRQVLDVED